MLGSGLAPDPGEDGSRRAVLGHAIWRDLYGGDPDVLGEPLHLDDEVYTVVGVMGPELDRLPPVGRVVLWLPFPTDRDPDHTVQAMARLAPGAGTTAVQDRLTAIDEGSRSDGPLSGFHPEVLRPADLFSQYLGRQLLVLQAAVALMLLVGCANVGNLFLVRAAGRRQELAVRGALGAGRGRIVRTLVLESLLVSAAGAALGLPLAAWGGRVLTRLRDWPFLDLDGLRLDPALFAFTAGAALLSTLAFGLIPALTASRSELGLTLRSSGPGAGGGGRARTALAVAEIALSLVLVVAAGLLSRHFVALLDTATGFEMEGLTAITVALPESRYDAPESRAAFRSGLQAGLDGLADRGVTAALASAPPTEGGITFGVLHAEGEPAPPDSSPPDLVAKVSTGEGYFRTTGIPIVEGRPLDADDALAEAGEGGETPVVINRRLAGRLWRGASPLGRRFALGELTADDPGFRVVGVAEDAALTGGRPDDFALQLYTPLRESEWLTVLLRSDEARRGAAVGRVVARIHELDPALAVRSVRSVEEIFREGHSGPRFQSALMAVFAVIALLLATLGVYAVLAFSVRTRSFEIGVRSALGARPGQVLALIGRQGAAIVGAGVLLGTAGALAAARLLGHLLGDVSPHDPLVYALAISVLLAACAGAVLVPALRASRLDPVRVLRRE